MSKKKVAQPADNAGKKPNKPNKKKEEPKTRQERRAGGKEKKRKKEAANKKDRAALISAAPGFTLAQLNAMNPPPKAVPDSTMKEAELLGYCTKTLEQLATSEESIWEVLDDFLGHNAEEDWGEEEVPPLVRVIIRNEDGSFILCSPRCMEEMIQPIALRNVLTAEVRRLVETIHPMLEGLRESPEAAVTAAELAFERQPQDLWLASIIVADNPAAEIEGLVDQVEGEVAELQLIGSALLPEYELDRAIKLETIDAATAERLNREAEEEARRIGLRIRFEEIATGDGGEIDETLANIIGESAEAAEAERRKRAQFRQKLAHGLRQRKEKEGRRYSSSPTESGDEEFIRFLLEHRGDLASVRENLPFALREQVQGLLADEERKGPILRRITALKATAQRRWTSVQSRLLAGADRPEETVAKNAPAIGALRNLFTEIGELNAALQEMDKPGPTSVKADYGTSQPRFGYAYTENWGKYSGIYKRHLA